MNTKSSLVLLQSNSDSCVSTVPQIYPTLHTEEAVSTYRLSQVERVSRAPKSYGMFKDTYLCPQSIITGLWFSCLATALYCNRSGSSL